MHCKNLKRLDPFYLNYITLSKYLPIFQPCVKRGQYLSVGVNPQLTLLVKKKNFWVQSFSLRAISLGREGKEHQGILPQNSNTNFPDPVETNFEFLCYNIHASCYLNKRMFNVYPNINLPMATNIQHDSSLPVSHIIMKSGNEMPRHIIVYLPLISLAINRYYIIIY